MELDLAGDGAWADCGCREIVVGSVECPANGTDVAKAKAESSVNTGMPVWFVAVFASDAMGSSSGADAGQSAPACPSSVTSGGIAKCDKVLDAEIVSRSVADKVCVTVIMTVFVGLAHDNVVVDRSGFRRVGVGMLQL